AQESGGRNLDVMQSSESIELPPNTIKSPVRSIKTGVDYFQQSIERMEQTDVDLDTAIQSYNYGLGYIDYINENGGKHTSELAEQFSKDWAEKMNWGNYGDTEYVDRVNQYRKNITK
ncbi:MAG: lysozyme family protein, partial [Carnobacterium sp.]|uniref:lysozyme family protein n=1 Tax=Carnobacterium sp. TaxID=48221 RepID=UPI002FC9CB56